MAEVPADECKDLKFKNSTVWNKVEQHPLLFNKQC